ncbi:Transcriptional regulator [Monosporozyma unispora]|nr:Transcriptional regulator [Kazachstania unispora]
MPRTSRRGKLPRGPRGKVVIPPPLPTKQSTSVSPSPSRRSNSPIKNSNNDNNNNNNVSVPTDINNLTKPSDVLSSVLTTLDLSFDIDIGMIKGHHMKNLPTNKQTLLDLQNKLNLLNDLFNQIIKDDNNNIEQIRQLEKQIVEKESLNKETKGIDETNEDSTASNVNEEQGKKKKEKEKTTEEEDEQKSVEISNTKPENTTTTETSVTQPSEVELTPIPETKSQDPPLVESVRPTEPINEKYRDVTETPVPVDNVTDETSVPLTSQSDDKNKEGASTNNEVSMEANNEKKRPLSDSTDENKPLFTEEPDSKKVKLEETSNVETSTVISTTPSESPAPSLVQNNTPSIPATTPSKITSNNNIPAEVSNTPSSIITLATDPNPMDKYTSDNDTRVKNPKSEFVVSQTLPKAAKDLGLYNEEGLETTGEEYLKKKYNVASYPTNDLKELLAGEIPDKDYSCPKPTNQIQFNTFLTFVDNFFKALNDDDIKFLENKYTMTTNFQMDKNYDPDVTPFIIPKLGPLYTNVWMKEDSKTLGNISPLPYRDSTSILPKKSAASLDDNVLETEDISCGPLLSRLLSAILTDEKDDALIEEMNHEQDIKSELNADGDTPHIIDEQSLTAQTSPAASVKDEKENLDHTTTTIHPPITKSIKLGGGTTNTIPNVDEWNINSLNLDYPTFEERLKRELKYVGIYMNLPKDENNPNGDDPDWLNGREDDEISAELRDLQTSLKMVTKRNQKRKEILKPLLERELAWQEYSSILDDLDKQIDQAYIKRIRAPKKKKKHHGSGSSANNNNHHGDLSASQLAQQKAANSSLKALLDKRQRWISKIGPLFDKPEIMKRIPKESIFKDMDQDDEDEEADGDVFEQNNENKDDEELTEA